jgi:hypothetical protein
VVARKDLCVDLDMRIRGDKLRGNRDALHDLDPGRDNSVVPLEDKREVPRKLQNRRFFIN